MKPRKVVGRYRELALFQQMKDSSDATFLAVFGRRRVGKTFLIRNALHDLIRFELIGLHNGSIAEQLVNFSESLRQASQGKLGRKETPASWSAAFRELAEFCETLPKKQKFVLFIDELPWLASPRSGFLQALDYFWNSYASRNSRLMLIVCGSAASWMIQRLLRDKGGLHNRVTHRMRLQPFDLAETRDFLLSRRIELTDFQIAELYMAFGGVPLYLEQVQRGESAAQSIDRVCFSPDGFLRNEFNQLYPALFDSAERHIEIVKYLAAKPSGLTRQEIADKTGQSPSGRLTTILEELTESGFVHRAAPWGKLVKDSIYRLADEYSLFYLRWIESWRRTSKGWLSVRNTPQFRTWSGMAFEMLCLKHADQIQAALGIAGVATELSAWRYSSAGNDDDGAQIDLLIDRADNSINLCEMKFSEDEFVLDKRYAKIVRDRKGIFRRVTGTRKNTFITFVTTHGTKKNSHALDVVDSDVMLESLFVPTNSL